MSKRNKHQNREPNRAYGKIQKLPAEIREAVDEMLRLNYKYRDIVDFIRDNANVDVDTSMVCRYAKRLETNLKEIRAAQENMRILMQEVQKYPDLDSSESIARILQSRVLSAIINVDESEWDEIAPLELLDKSAKLMRVVTHKKDVDFKIKNIKEIAIIGLKEELSQMQQEDPALYNRLFEYLEKN
jgi:hypothetical protein